MTTDEGKSKTIWLRSKWRFLAVVVAATLLIAALILVVMTAPISELIMSFRNAEDTDTVQLVVYLDGSQVDRLYIGADGVDGLKFHVSPGTHTVGIDFAYDGQPDETVDFTWTTFVNFNGVNHNRLLIDRQGIGPDPLDMLGIFLLTKTPLEQAIRDPNVTTPALTLAVLHVILVIAVWNYLRHGPKGIGPEKSP